MNPTISPERIKALAAGCRDNIIAYSAFVDPSYVPNRFHRYLASRIMPALERGRGRFMVFAPPQNGKSIFVSRLLPAYVLGRYPTWPIIAASYGDDLAQYNGGIVRDYVGGPAHSLVFPESQLKSGSAAKDFFETTLGGRYMGTTVRGGATGFASKLFIIDDPFKNRQDADSPVVQKAVYDWYKSVVYTRLAEDSILILMHTRWNLEDLAGKLLEEQAHEGWEIINLPAVAEENDLMGRMVGEPLVPERFSGAALERIKQTLGGGDARDWLALYQQRPIPDGGGEFKEAWMRFYGSVGSASAMNKLILVDPANGKRKENDYTSMWVIGLNADQNAYVLDIVRDRLNLEQRASMLFRLHRKWRPGEVRYEQYGLQADIQHLQSKMESDQYRFKITEVGGQVRKEDRIRRLVPMFSAGRIWFPNQFWYTRAGEAPVDLVSEFLEDEFKPFPVGRHDDMLDGLARLMEPDLDLNWPRERESEAFVIPSGPLDYETGF